MSDEQLTIVVDAQYLISTGYGTAWRAQVREVVGGQLADDQLRLSLYEDSDGRHYRGRFRMGSEAKGVRLTLHKLAKHPGALSGFVAKDGTVWEIGEVAP
jgi:hypothetical protein